MSPEIERRVYEPFVTTKEPGVGTDLGLAIAASVIRDYGVVIAVKSTAGGGSTFMVSLPKAS